MLMFSRNTLFLKLSFDKNSTTLLCYMCSVLYALYIIDTNVDILGLDIQVNVVATVLKAFLKLSFDKNSSTLPCYMHMFR